MRLKFQLIKFYKGLAFQVIQQNSKFLNDSDEQRIEFQSKNIKLKIVSEHLTRLDLNNFELHLRGSYADKILEIPTTIFSDNKIRDEWYNYILDAIVIWANTCESFQEMNERKLPKLKKRGYTFEI